MRLTTDHIVEKFAAARMERDALRLERAGLTCEWAEQPHGLDVFEASAAARPSVIHELKPPGQPEQAEPCWKAARRWADNGPDRPRFYFDPPQDQWCETCQRRQAVSDKYREAVRKHAGALRAVLARGRSIASAEVK